MSTGEQLRAALAEVDCLNADIAELVALLRMGKELAEAARDSTQGTPQKRYRASNEASAILERYDEAIAKHGGG